MNVDSTLDQIELIRSMAMFGGLNRGALELILEQSEQAHFAEGEYFFREGDCGDNVYVIKSGTVLVERLWNGEPIVLARVGRGDCFGEMSLIDFQKRFASIRAESECEVIRIPFDVLRHLCQYDMQQYFMVMMNLGREVSRRLRIAGDRLFQYQQELGLQSFDDDLTGET